MDCGCSPWLPSASHLTIEKAEQLLVECLVVLRPCEECNKSLNNFFLDAAGGEYISFKLLPA